MAVVDEIKIKREKVMDDTPRTLSEFFRFCRKIEDRVRLFSGNGTNERVKKILQLLAQLRAMVATELRAEYPNEPIEVLVTEDIDFNLPDKSIQHVRHYKSLMLELRGYAITALRKT